MKLSMAKARSLLRIRLRHDRSHRQRRGAGHLSPWPCSPASTEPQGSSAREKARAVAASLAEQDQERMRAMSVDDARRRAAASRRSRSTGSATRSSPRPSGSPTTPAARPPAATRRNNSEYFHITSTVTLEHRRRPHPAGQDRLAGQPERRLRPGARHVRRQGRRPQRQRGHPERRRERHRRRRRWRTQATDQNGCVIWRSIAVGNYTAHAQPGRLRRRDRHARTRSARQTVSPNTVTFVQFSYDRVGIGPGRRQHPRPRARPSARRQRGHPEAVARSPPSADNMLADRTWIPTPATARASLRSRDLFPVQRHALRLLRRQCELPEPGNARPDQLLHEHQLRPRRRSSIRPSVTAAGERLPAAAELRVSKELRRRHTCGGQRGRLPDAAEPTAFTSDSCAERGLPVTTMSWTDPDATG